MTPTRAPDRVGNRAGRRTTPQVQVHVRGQLPLPLPVASGLDAAARYALGFATPTIDNLLTAQSFVHHAYGEAMATAMASAYHVIWPGWQHGGRSRVDTVDRKEWRLTELGIDEVAGLFADPSTSWRRALSRAVIVSLARCCAVPDKARRQLDYIPTLKDQLKTDIDPKQHGWLPTSEIGTDVHTILERIERGDPLRLAFRGIRAPVHDPAVGRVLWRLEQEGLVRSRRISAAGRQPELFLPPAQIGRLRQQLLNPPLTPIGERLLVTRRRSARTDVPERMVGTSLHIQQIAQALLTHHADPVAAISREHVVRLGTTNRRLDIAVWTPEDDVGFPSIWIEVTVSRSKSGSTLKRLRQHIFTAAAASAAWNRPISLYIVGPARRAHLSAVQAAIEEVALARFGRGTDLAISVVAASEACLAPVWRVPPLRTVHYH